MDRRLSVSYCASCTDRHLNISPPRLENVNYLFNSSHTHNPPPTHTHTHRLCRDRPRRTLPLQIRVTGIYTCALSASLCSTHSSFLSRFLDKKHPSVSSGEPTQTFCCRLSGAEDWTPTTCLHRSRQLTSVFSCLREAHS